MNLTTRTVLIALTLLQASCNNSETRSRNTIDKNVSIASGGVHIDYTDSKNGDTCLLFVHGWNIDKTYWQKQDSFFSKKYRIVTVDLPGFGKSGKNRQSWTVENYGADITAIIKNLDLRNVILIGHSMSGAIVVEAALKNPDRVIGVVGVDNFTNFGAVPSPEEKKDVAAAYKALRTNYKEIVVQYANQSLFSPSTDSIVRKRVLHDFVSVDSTLATEILETNDAYPLDEKLKSLGKTLYLINSSYHPTDTTRFEKYKVPYDLYYVGPTGHYPMIENPNEFNLLLEKIIKGIGSRPK